MYSCIVVGRLAAFTIIPWDWEGEDLDIGRG
jgi:hypothetical protein